MTEVDVSDSSTLISNLRPSAWMREGIKDPDNTIAILGKKGGPGKTSLAQNVIDAAVRMGLNVLALDGDPQGNLSIALDSQVQRIDTGKTSIGGKKVLEPDRLTMVEVLAEDADGVIDEAVQLCPWEYKEDAEFTRGGPLVPGKLGTVGVVPTYSPMEDLARGWSLSDLNRLDRALHRPLVSGGVAPSLRWDLVIGDMLPGGSDLARVFLKAMRRYVLLTTAQPFGINAISDTLTFARDTRDNWGNPRLQDLGLVFTSYTPQGRVARQQMADLRAAQQAGVEDVNVEVWEPRMSTRTVVPTSQSYRAQVSRFLTEKSDRVAATEICQISEAILLKILHKIGHPDAADLEERWRAAWPDLSPWATGEITKKETA
ncbi:ParA family protein [Nocardia nova]|uniref:ParA family protein n=1 Tax=Nocardia nova TaxID=37330 RepID=UPI0033C2E13E